MPTFTDELRTVLHRSYGDALYDYIDMSGTVKCPDNFKAIGLHDYPLYDENYRNELNKKIVRHFFNREIGQETESLFKLMLNRTLWENAPIFNAYYKTQLELAGINPLDSMDILNTTHNATNDHQTSTANNTSDTTATSKAVNYAMPQTQLDGTEEYASSATTSDGDTKVTGTGTNDTTGTGTQDGTNRTTGHSDAAMAAQAYRAAVVSTDILVFNILEPLFMVVWDNGDEYFAENNLMSGANYYGPYYYPFGI